MEEHSAAYKIFHYKYNFSIPGIHFYSQEYLDTVGMVSTGNKADDKELMKRPINTRGTVMEIAQHFADDHPVTLENGRDAVAMYESVRDHLANWKKALAMESNLPDAPIDQLRILDEFATSIFEIARRYKPAMIEKVSISTRLRSLGGNAGASLRRGIDTGVVSPAVEKPKEIPVHHPVIDIIDEYYSKRS